MVKKAAGVKGKKTVVGGAAAGGSDNSKSLFKKNPRNFRIGGDIQPKRDLTRMVKWPRYIRIQRQKVILMKRLKVPPSIAQFSHTLEKNQHEKLFKLLKKYSTESKADKKQRLKAAAEAKAGKSAKPLHVKFGLNHVTTLVEQNKAKLVVIAHDVDPIETIIHLPALCRAKEVPFCFVAGKANLGKVCHMKTATCLAVTEVHKEDYADLEALRKQYSENYNKNEGLRKKWGGGIMGLKNQHMVARREKIREIELAKKANM